MAHFMERFQMTKRTQGKQEHWKQDPDEHDYPAANDYLTLLCIPKVAEALVNSLREAPIEIRKAKDLLRASGLKLLPSNDYHVLSDLKKVAKGKPLSPVLLVRGNTAKQFPLTVADGYHRICASYYLDENEDIPCRITEAKYL